VHHGRRKSSGASIVEAAVASLELRSCRAQSSRINGFSTDISCRFFPAARLYVVLQRPDDWRWQSWARVAFVGPSPFGRFAARTPEGVLRIVIAVVLAIGAMRMC